MGSLERMKELEREYHTYLPKKSYAVLRVDGKGFSKYTRGLVKPFDMQFTEDMGATAKYLCENIDGAVLGYTQSDEISVVFSDLGGANTEWWYGGQVQKLVSVGAAMATAKFNSLRDGGPLALFDARVHHLEGVEGVLEYLRWRETDANKNSVGMLASHHFSHKSLMGASTEERLLRLLFEKGIRWSDLPVSVTHGSVVKRELRDKKTTYLHNGVQRVVNFQRKEWVVGDAPNFYDMKGLDFT